MDSLRVIKPGVRRRRPPLACIQCYQRKLKCGRESPCCSRCVKSGNAERCTYRDKTARNSLVNGAFAHDTQPQMESGAMVEPCRTPVSLADKTERSLKLSKSNVKATHLKGEETLTIFYGYSYPLNFYQQFAELRSYIAQVKTQNPAINSLRDEIYSPANDGHRQRPSAHEVATASTLAQLVPMKSVADTLVQTYLDRFEVLHRVLDKSAFIAEYNCHWTSPLCTPSSFLVQLLLVSATAAIFHSEIYTDVEGQQPIRDQVMCWIGAAESWLHLPTNQPPQSWNILATHCLLLIAKRANYIQENSLWMSTGAVIRWAMAAGYHREAPSTARISHYQREMRRRLWATIVELDLQAAVERGMPPNIGVEDFHLKSPLNIDDKSLQELRDSDNDLPEEMPNDVLTDTFFQSQLCSSLAVRLEICASVNSCREQDDFDRVLVFGQKLEEEVQSIPERNDAGNDPRQQQKAMYVKRLLLIHLYQYMLLLYFQFAVQAPPSFKSNICRRARLEASLKLLDHYQSLIQEEKVPEQACRVGLILAALNICHEIYTDIRLQNTSQSTTIAISPMISKCLVATVENALQVLEKRIIVVLEGLNEYYILSMIIGLLKSQLWPDSCLISDQEAADRVVGICTAFQLRQAAVRSDTNSVVPRELYLQEDTNSMLSNGTTGFFDSILSEDIDFFKDSNAYTFLQAF